jgi:hypothetical protein
VAALAREVNWNRGNFAWCADFAKRAVLTPARGFNVTQRSFERRITMPEGGEKAWVETLTSRLTAALKPVAVDGVTAEVCSGHRLLYAHEIASYSDTAEPKSLSRGYETDLLILDRALDQSWVPRVVIECKLGSITTHDALTYSAKAATHKHVHPYLRYGILVGGWGNHPLPPRLVRHGAYFDFMAILQERTPTEAEFDEIGEILRQEVRASRQLQSLLTDKSGGKKIYRLLHRPLVLKEHA